LLTDEINKTFISSLFENIEEKHSIDKVLNIVLSSHLSSMFISMKFISSQDKKLEKYVDIFINKLQNFLGNSPILDDFEHMH
jgi:hypothetical protein